ncbi:ArsR/SmtB family transcription factor [Galactobacter caseinivorans]|uniref:ArsR family transcriptional regulator n=1 Tax=Galactobacter caseinivorans TaxID=2676123 RepID=A0A496PN53_9MICC|nr:winged helix-turn-helix domain-containing protein [Galactobacter caseinivorans]RKW71963.1 ArsR family transcriptional regulator [Galactobacter caseinivorans]
MTSDETAQARARALSSPVRLRILRLCLHQARTNKEIADALGMNPATTLHHVRTLLNTGFLEAEAERKGKRGAKEVPYLSTRLSWSTPLPDAAPVLVETFLQEVNGLAPDEIQVMRVGLRLGEEDQRELLARMRELIEDFAVRPAPQDAVSTSLFVAHHLDTSAG